VYDLREQKVLYTLANHADDVTSVAFSPNGEIFCTAGADGAVNFYSIASQQPIRTFRNLGFVREISFSPDGSRVVSCGDDSRISIWPVDTASRVGEARFTNLHEKWLSTAKLHQDNQSLVTGSVLGKIEIDIPYGKYFDHLRVAPSDIEFKPHNRNLLILAVATLGQGVLILDASDMKFRK
jgi:WD40 repeat protein